MSCPTRQHDPWTHETRTRTGPWRLAILNTGCTCGWTGPTYDLHDTTPGLAHDEAVWAHQDHLDTDSATPAATPNNADAAHPAGQPGD
jgi:hypothetical protein